MDYLVTVDVWHGRNKNGCATDEVRVTFSLQSTPMGEWLRHSIRLSRGNNSYSYRIKEIRSDASCWLSIEEDKQKAMVKKLYDAWISKQDGKGWKELSKTNEVFHYEPHTSKYQERVDTLNRRRADFDDLTWRTAIAENEMRTISKLQYSTMMEFRKALGEIFV